MTGNLYPTRLHVLNFTGYNWLRLTVTAASEASPNNDVSVQMDIHDAHLGFTDTFLFLGDSITLEGMLHPMLGGGDWGYGGALAEIISTSTNGVHYPATIDGGNGGMTMAWAATNIAGLLADFPGSIVSLAFGTNDANQPFQYIAGDSHVTTYYANLLTCIDACLALGYLVIVPYVPYGQNNGGDLGYNANLFNQYVDQHLPTDRPTVLRGPDFWTFFNDNPTLIRNDGGTQIHPTYIEVGGAPSGYEAMHQLWAAWIVEHIYLQYTDAATGSETITVVTPVAQSDSGTGSESTSITAQLPVGDSSTGVDQVTLGVDLSDAGVGGEILVDGVAEADSGMGGEVIAIFAQLPIGDAGVGSEQISVPGAAGTLVLMGPAITGAAPDDPDNAVISGATLAVVIILSTQSS